MFKVFWVLRAFRVFRSGFGLGSGVVRSLRVSNALGLRELYLEAQGTYQVLWASG